MTKKSKDTVEKERRWLLKAKPEEIFDNIYKTAEIEQFYTSDGWRYRNMENNENGKIMFTKTKKVRISRGVNEERETTKITKKEYDNEFPGTRVVRKTRYIIEHNGKKLEIDEFNSCNLVILELEGVEMEDSVSFPDWVEKYILMEITGNPVFDNYNLADTDIESEEDDYSAIDENDFWSDREEDDSDNDDDDN